MTRKVLEVILRLNPEQIVCKEYNRMCKAVKDGRHCVRKKDHDGFHVTLKVMWEFSALETVRVDKLSTKFKIWKK